MRLFLSSQGLGNHADRLLDMVGEKSKVLYVYNAKDDLAFVERAEQIAEKRTEFERIGLTFEELDLRDYFGKKTELKERLDGIGLLFVGGGNTFILRRAIKYSGLDDLIVENLMHDAFVYAGSSAGSMVVSPNLHGTERGDSLDIVPSGYKDEVVWGGLHLVDFYFIPHYLSDWFGDKAQMMKEYFDERHLPYKALMDGQVYIVDGTQQELLT
jgi:dipeptidase E